jgi:pSer/pThr/pTyr-binding forkhead associated (FHA) protein
MGLFVGMVGGLPTLSLRRARNGAVGGLIGGAVGGFVFESLQAMSTFQPFQIRLVGFALLGAAIGFFVGLVGEVFKQAWVRVLVGRNEGREHVIDSPVAVIGRDELADIPIFLDPVLAPRQASIRFQDGRHYLYDEAGRADTRLRGQPLPAGQGLPLTDGDVIQVGRVSLAFHEKATAVPGSHRVAAPVAVVPRPGGAVCEFCGVARDPLTGACACSVAGTGAAVPGGSPTVGGVATVYADPGAYPPPQAENPFAPYMNPPAPTQDVGWGAPAPMGGIPQLVTVAGPYAGQVFPLGAPVVAIGRDPARDIALSADSMTSRRHASIYAQGGAFVVRDDGSSNGTFVNGARIAEQALYPGDELRVGGTTFRFEA